MDEDRESVTLTHPRVPRPQTRVLIRHGHGNDTAPQDDQDQLIGSRPAAGRTSTGAASESPRDRELLLRRECGAKSWRCKRCGFFPETAARSVPDVSAWPRHPKLSAILSLNALVEAPPATTGRLVWQLQITPKDEVPIEVLSDDTGPGVTRAEGRGSSQPECRMNC